MRLVLAAAAVAAASLAAPADAACSLGQLGTNPFACGPAVPDDERGTVYAVGCESFGGFASGAAYVPYAMEVTVTCEYGGRTVSDSQDGPVARVSGTLPGAGTGPICVRVSWWYPDYTTMSWASRDC